MCFLFPETLILSHFKFNFIELKETEPLCVLPIGFRNLLVVKRIWCTDSSRFHLNGEVVQQNLFYRSTPSNNVQCASKPCKVYVSTYNHPT